MHKLKSQQKVAAPTTSQWKQHAPVMELKLHCFAIPLLSSSIQQCIEQFYLLGRKQWMGMFWQWIGLGLELNGKCIQKNPQFIKYVFWSWQDVLIMNKQMYMNKQIHTSFSYYKCKHNCSLHTYSLMARAILPHSISVMAYLPKCFHVCVWSGET